MRLLRLILPTLLLVISTCSSASSASLTRTTHTHAFKPHWKASVCPFKVDPSLKQGKDVRCGFVTVPEVRSNPNSRTLKLAVAIFHSQSANRAADPEFYLNGGPGGPTLFSVGPYINQRDSSFIVGDRDLVLIDQRGTGYSKPSLTCREVTNLQYNTLAQNVSAAQSVALDNKAVKQCHDRLVRAGINLNAYTTPADAADIADVRKALGYRSINLYGISYGTRLAQEVMSLYPTGIRSVVLDSTVPPFLNLFADPPRSGQRAMNVLFRGCAQATTCHKNYPHLEADYIRLLARWQAHPVTFKSKDVETTYKTYKVLLNGGGLASVLFEALYQTPVIPLLPRAIENAARGNFTVLANVFGQVAYPYPESYGMQLSVACSEGQASTSAANIRAAADVAPSPIRADNRILQVGNLQQCKIWHVKSIGWNTKTLVHSSIPTMVMAGQYDPITPPAGAARVAGALKDSYFFLYPGLGHGERFSHPCPNTMLQSFFDSPNHKPDAACIAGMTAPFQ
jgi:pimeloyl-ACP methyl ester carboxylesterase